MNPYNQYFCGNDGGALEITNEMTSGTYRAAEWFSEWATGGRSAAGVAVTGYTALTHCPLWQGVNIIAGDFGQTPVRLLKDEFDEQRKHPAWNLLRVRPNQLQTPSVWKETMMQWALIWGNGVSWIRRQGSRPVELIPLRPDCLWHEVIAFEDRQIILYHYQGPYRFAPQYTFFPHEVVHFQGLTGDGVWGYPLFQIARETIGHGLALEKHGNATFANGATPGGVLEAPVGNGISKNAEARANLRKEWNEVHRGPDKAGAVAILWEGITFKQMQQSNVDSEWIEAKKLGIYEAAGLLNLPPHKLGALEDSSVRANLEEQNADYVNRTLNRHYNRADEEYRRKLLTEVELMADIYQFKHDSDSFLRGDIDTLTTVADRCVKAELMNRNEGRRMIGLPPYEGGDKFGSPAINPQSSDGKESPDNGRPAGAKTEHMAVNNTHRALLYDRVLHLIECESTRLRHAAANTKNFLAWIDDFYLGGFKMLALAKSIMGPSLSACSAVGMECRGFDNAIAAYAKKRHAQCLEACSNVTKEGLPDAIEALIGSEQSLIAQGLLATALGEV